MVSEGDLSLFEVTFLDEGQRKIGKILVEVDLHFFNDFADFRGILGPHLLLIEIFFLQLEHLRSEVVQILVQFQLQSTYIQHVLLQFRMIDL